MSVALSQFKPRKGSMRQFVPWIGMFLCLAVLLSHLGQHWLGLLHADRAVGAAAPGPQTKPAGKSTPSVPGQAKSVTLKNSKLDSVQLAVEPARIERVATGVSVVGVTQVNADRQVEIRPRAAGFVREVHVALGQKVKQGDPLVTLDCPEIGRARLNLRGKQLELSTARFEANWKSEIAANIALLIPKLKKGINERRHAVADDAEHTEIQPRTPRAPTAPISSKTTDAQAIEKDFAGKQLGAYRGTLLQAYAEFDIASHEEQKTASLRSLDIVGEHPALVARHTREGVQAKLEAAIQKVEFDAAQEKRLADQTVQLAEAAVVIAAQQLRILGVPENIQDLLDHAGDAIKIARNEDLTFYRIAAPFDGAIIKKEKSAVSSQRADPAEFLFVLADLRAVWVTANVSESDLSKISKLKDGSFRLSATAYPDREFSARLLSVGAIVDPQTRTVPILAQAENPDGLFWLGMFVRIHLDSSATERVLTVPAAAVVEIEAEKFVFTPAEKGIDEQTFTLRPVELGKPSGDRIVIKAGLKEGDQVVSAGAFLLKSELILQKQGDEE
jgi:cobalt-zinc-cadmium efflux system membrane fusion protein